MIDWMCEHYGFTREAMKAVYDQHHNGIDPEPDACPVCRAKLKNESARGTSK